MTRLLQNYLIIGAPFVIACMIWQTCVPDISTTAGNSSMLNILWNALGINLMFWFLCLILFLSLMLIAPGFREKTLTRLANIREEDEREQYITGQAAKKSYISTLSLTIFLLFFSLFSMQVTWGPKTIEKGNHQGSVNIGLGFSLLNKSSVESVEKNMEQSSEKVLFDSTNISLSSAAIILILLTWQLLAFNISARKLSKL